MIEGRRLIPPSRIDVDSIRNELLFHSINIVYMGGFTYAMARSGLQAGLAMLGLMTHGIRWRTSATLSICLTFE